MFAVFSFIILQSCNNDTSYLFTLLPSSQTGIHFKNILKEDENANVLNYTYFYNGGGVAIGDINNDGLPDILFTGNMVANRLYLNKGNFKFEDITEKSGVAKMQGWCTGTAIADVNGDGKLDIYICRSADANATRRKNLLFINNGDLTFTEEAEKFGLADKGYSTQAVFFDYDKDGDLDMFLINHSLQQYAEPNINAALRNEHLPAFAVKLYCNNDGFFSDISEQAGITSNVLSFGLGLAVSDFNNDGWPDVYVSNDFNEPDYLFMNNGNGTFTEKLKDCMDETSFYSMGCDAADFDNDGLIDLMTLDMLPEDNHLQKMHSGAENFDKFQYLFSSGFYYQYSRNMLQKNNGDGTFSEIGQLAGVSNTDWSWSALFSDFDNDGNKDLFITNGYAKDFTNMDFLRYKMDLQFKQSHAADVKSLLNKMPSVVLPNYIFKNNGDETFTKVTDSWGLNKKTISSGAAYADLDNDGDVDIVINNIEEESFIYRNNTEKINPQNHYLKIKLIGTKENINGIGAKVKLYCKGNLYYQEQMPERGFQSSVDHVLNFGINKNLTVDSLIIIWPDNMMQKLLSVKANQLIVLNHTDANIPWNYDITLNSKTLFTASSTIHFAHKENTFRDFSVQPLMPNYLSRQGPCIAKADINNDGREDIFIGGAKGESSSIFIQTPGGNFIQKPEPGIANDSLCEVVATCFFDANSDGKPDLYIGNGGYEFSENDAALQDRLYLNDGKGNFKSAENALPQMLISTACVKDADLDGDGDLDLFVGGRLVPGKYPVSPQSKILLNNGKGVFTDATKKIAPQLANIGMVTDALWLDVNEDNKKDLIVVGEWMPVKILINRNSKLIDESAEYIKFPSAGWWSRIAAADFDGDGDSDLVIGNCGSNTQFNANAKEPVRMYYKDFGNNGNIEPILSYYINRVSYPMVSKDDLTDQFPFLRNKFLEYSSYADATIDDIFSKEQMKGADSLKAEIMQTIYLKNKGTDGFMLKPLPIEAQYAPVNTIAVADINGDGKKDIILAGNNSWSRIKFGRYRANHGVVLLGDGKNNFTYLPQNKSGLNVRGDVRSMQFIQSSKNMQLIFGLNDDSVKRYYLNYKR